MEYVDLHVHSTKSDGSFTPAELVEYALEKGLSAFALTDHDTVEGIDEAILAAAGTSLRVIAGVELSTDYQGRDIHILGLFIDWKNKEFVERLNTFRDARHNRNKKMCQKLCDTGISISMDELHAANPDSVITRAHYAKFLLEKGYVKSMPEAFERYIGDHAPCFVSREKVTPCDAVKLILYAGGIPILAHPILYGMGNDSLNLLISALKDAGLAGIEAIYSTYTQHDEQQMRQLASQYDLLISGGSDFHGINKKYIDLAVGRGKLFIPLEILTRIENYHQYKKIPQEDI